MAGDDAAVNAAAHSLNARAMGPGQTPVVRRTGAIAPVKEPPKKKSLFATILAAILLLGVIAYGANKIRPVFEAARELHEAQVKSGRQPPTAAPTNTIPEDSNANPATNANDPENLAQPKETVEAPASGGETKPLGLKPEKIVPKKVEPAISVKAAQFKGRIEEAISEKDRKSVV